MPLTPPGVGRRFRVRTFLVRPPWWGCAVLFGLLAGITGDLFRILFGRHMDLSDLLVYGTLSGLAFGATAGPRVAGERRALWNAVEPYPAGDEGKIDYVLRRGPVPEDQALCAAALRLGHEHLTRWGAHSRAVTGGLVCGLILLTGGLALASSPSWWVLTAVVAVLGVYGAHRYRHLRTRVALLHTAFQSEER